MIKLIYIIILGIHVSVVFHHHCYTLKKGKNIVQFFLCYMYQYYKAVEKNLNTASSLEFLFGKILNSNVRAVESAFNTPVIQTDKSVRFTCPNKHLPVRIISKITTNIEKK